MCCFWLHLNNNWILITVDAKANQFAGFSIQLELVFCYKKVAILALVNKHLLSTITTVKMSRQIAHVNWSRWRYSDVFHTAIVDPSPIKQGKKVWVIWGKTKKKYTAVLSSYPVNDENKPESSKDDHSHVEQNENWWVSTCLNLR